VAHSPSNSPSNRGSASETNLTNVARWVDDNIFQVIVNLPLLSVACFAMIGFTSLITRRPLSAKSLQTFASSLNSSERAKSWLNVTMPVLRFIGTCVLGIVEVKDVMVNLKSKSNKNS